MPLIVSHTSLMSRNKVENGRSIAKSDVSLSKYVRVNLVDTPSYLGWKGAAPLFARGI